MNPVRCLLLTIALAAIAPWFATQRGSAHSATLAIPPWPHEFDGRPLQPVALTAEEARFMGDFPGAVARFTDGESEILMRWVTQPTRKLHPAEDCYRAWGFELTTSRIRADRDGSRWRCFTAARNGGSRQVCEQIRDGEGAHFTDVSSWYWDATLQHSQAPWLVVTVASTHRDHR
jgi:hypothetical protein